MRRLPSTATSLLLVSLSLAALAQAQVLVLLTPTLNPIVGDRIFILVLDSLNGQPAMDQSVRLQIRSGTGELSNVIGDMGTTVAANLVLPGLYVAFFRATEPGEVVIRGRTVPSGVSADLTLHVQPAPGP